MDVQDEGTVVCFSGGIDSTVVLIETLRAHGPEKVVAMAANYGQPHRHELVVGAAFCKSRGIPYEEVPISFSLSGYAGRSSALSREERIAWTGPRYPDDIIGRNLHIIAAAEVVAYRYSFGVIAVGHNLEDGQGRAHRCIGDRGPGGFQDATEDYFKALSTALQYGGGPRIETPLINMSKKEVVQRATELGINIGETWTCFYPQWTGPHQPEECGVCGACADKRKAMGVQHSRDPVEGAGDKA